MSELNKDQVDALVKEVGKQTSDKIAAEFKSLEEKYEKQLTEAKEAQSKEYEEIKAELTEAKEIIKNQALTMDQLKSISYTDVKQQKQVALQALHKSLTDNKEAIEKTASGGTVKISLKTAGVISSSNFGTGVLQGLRLAEIERIDRDPFFILGLINVINGGEGSDPFSWVEMQDKEGAPAPTAESSDKPYKDYNWVENKVTAETIAAVVPVTKQATKKMPMLENMIRTELISELQLVLQNQILRGDGATPNLKGITEYAAAFAAGGLAASVNDPQEADVLRAVVAQIYRNHGIATGLLIHPDKAAMMDLIKGTDGHYTLRPFASADGQIISGARVYQDFGLDADAFIGGAFNKSMLNIVEDITLEIGWINDMFLKNQYAIRAEIMCAHGIKAQHANKFVSDNFTTAKAALIKSLA